MVVLTDRLDMTIVVDWVDLTPSQVDRGAWQLRCRARFEILWEQILSFTRSSQFE